MSSAIRTSCAWRTCPTRRPVPGRCSSGSARSASTRWTPTSARAPTRASRSCPTRQAPTRPARSRPSAPASPRSRRASASTSSARSLAPSARARNSRCAIRRRCTGCPTAVSFEQGAAVGVPYGTAYRALFQRAQARPGESVLVHGGSGGVGTAAIQLARAAGLVVLATAGTDRGLAHLTAQGADARLQSPDDRLHRADHGRHRRPRRGRHPRDAGQRQSQPRPRPARHARAASSSSATAARSRSTRARRWPGTRTSAG